jgi:zinc-ribbon domain
MVDLCPTCGSQNGKGAKYCSNCGTPMASSSQATQKNPAVVSYNPYDPGQANQSASSATSSRSNHQQSPVYYPPPPSTALVKNGTYKWLLPLAAIVVGAICFINLIPKSATSNPRISDSSEQQQFPSSESVPPNRKTETATELSLVDRAKQEFNDPACTERNRIIGYTQRNDGYDPADCQVVDVKLNPSGSIEFPYIVTIRSRHKSTSLGERTFPDYVGDVDVQWDGSSSAKN